MKFFSGKRDRKEDQPSRESGNQPPCSIYDYIKSNTKDGRLPEGFEIPWIQDMWAPGAHDGVSLNHMAPIEFTPDPERDREILKALKWMASENNSVYLEKVLDVFDRINQKYALVRLYDTIIQLIVDHLKELNLPVLLRFGDYLICKGVSLETGKLGLNVIAPFNAPFVEEVALEFGIYEEFTYYAARILTSGNWPNGNAELFELAKKVDGWGRIHAAEMLEPETQEIRDWLLFEGADNTVEPQYSANICLQKAEAMKRLDGALTEDEFAAIGKLISESLWEGPCRGVTDGEQLLPKYITRAREFQADPDVIQSILDAAEEYHLTPDVIRNAKELMGG